MSRDDHPGRLKRVSTGILSKTVKDKTAEILLKTKDGGLTSLADDDFDLDEVIGVLGSGKQGKVYPVTVFSPDGNGSDEERPCVLKVLPKKRNAQPPVNVHGALTDSEDTSTRGNVLKEIARMVRDDAVYSILPYCSFFLNHFEAHLKTIDSDDPIFTLAILHIVIDLLDALAFMHGRGFVHRDIKMENVAFYRGHWCLIDLDCAAVIGSQDAGPGGSVFYMHPACFREGVDRSTRPENDVYAIGILIEILLRKLDLAQVSHETPRDFMARKAREYLQKAKAETQEELRMRTESKRMKLDVSEDESILSQLLRLADGMTTARMSHQPDLSNMREYCNQLMDLFEMQVGGTDKLDALEQRLNEHYRVLETNSIAKTSDYFASSGSMSSLSDEESAGHRRLSIFSRSASPRGSLGLFPVGEKAPDDDDVVFDMPSPK